MLSPETAEMLGVFLESRVRILQKRRAGSRREGVWALTIVCLVVLAFTAAASGPVAYEGEEFEQINRQGLGQIDRINEALQRTGRIFFRLGVVLLAIVALKIIGPLQICHSIKDRLLEKAVRDVDVLLRKIQEEAEATSAISSNTVSWIVPHNVGKDFLRW